MSEIQTNTLTGSATPELNIPSSSPTPSEPEVKTETPTPEGAEAPEADAAKSEDAKEEPKPRQSRARERIEQLAKDNRNLKRSLSRANQKIGEFRAERVPREEDFQDHAQYHTAVVSRAVKDAALQGQRETLAEEYETLQKNRMSAWNDISAEARTKYSDWDAVFTADVPVSPSMGDYLMDHSKDPDSVAYWLGKNRGEANRIYDMPPLEAALALKDIEHQLRATKPRTVSSAPSPVETVGGKAHATGKALSEMNYDEYKAFRMAQEREKLGALPTRKG